MHNGQPKLALPDGFETRKVFHQEQWCFSIIDVMTALVGRGHPCKYWSDLKNKLIAERYFEVPEKIWQFRMPVPAGKLGLTGRVNRASKKLKKGGTE